MPSPSSVDNENRVQLVRVAGLLREARTCWERLAPNVQGRPSDKTLLSYALNLAVISAEDLIDGRSRIKEGIY